MPEEQNIENIEKIRPEAPGAAVLPEKKPEQGMEAKEKLDQALDQLEDGPSGQAEGEQGLAGGIVSASNRQLEAEERVKKIERILEKDMDSIYLGLSEDKKREFKAFGEQTARQIDFLVESGKATARKIIDLIKKWLQIVPGINRFFLEQEAKIKSDEILSNKQ